MVSRISYACQPGRVSLSCLRHGFNRSLKPLLLLALFLVDGAVVVGLEFGFDCGARDCRMQTEKASTMLHPACCHASLLGVLAVCQHGLESSNDPRVPLVVASSGVQEFVYRPEVRPLLRKRGVGRSDVSQSPVSGRVCHQAFHNNRRISKQIELPPFVRSQASRVLYRPPKAVCRAH